MEQNNNYTETGLKIPSVFSKNLKSIQMKMSKNSLYFKVLFKIYRNRILVEIYIDIKAEENEKVKKTMHEIEKM